MHGNDDSAHQINIFICVEFGDENLVQEYFRFLEVAVIHGHIVGTVQIGSIHAINGGDNPMETGSEVADVPHPTEHWRYVSQSRTESKHRE